MNLHSTQVIFRYSVYTLVLRLYIRALFAVRYMPLEVHVLGELVLGEVGLELGLEFGLENWP